MQEQGKGVDGGLSSAANASEFSAVVVAAGASSRFGGETAKQYLTPGGRSLVERAVAAVRATGDVDQVVVVLPGPDVDGPPGRAARRWPGVRAVVAGGETRADSVRAGLAHVATRYVLVHDAARPNARPALVGRVVEAVRQHGAAVPVVPIPDTVKATGTDGSIERTVDRSRLVRAQTPQGARTDWLVEALAAAEGESPTDDAAALERAGRRVQTVAGDPDNVKITTPDDVRAAGLGTAAAPPLRIGSGYDVHRFAEGRRLRLAGIEIPGEPGLAGHSDADVVLHAAMDALLGAAALGDIGRHFPPADECWKDADSRQLAATVRDLLERAGYRPVNLDLTVLAERPKIGPHATAMQASLANCFGLDPSRISIKATTLEGLGALGRGEGIACQATALIERVDG